MLMSHGMKRIVLILGCLLMVVCCYCRKTRPREVRVIVPELNGSVFAELSREAFIRSDGVLRHTNNLARVVIALEKKLVVVQYDSLRTANKNIEHDIAALGFSANDIPPNADARARLPPDCR